jgi:thiosulfate/3-mercaptopyruvate sulfurtransferase
MLRTSILLALGLLLAVGANTTADSQTRDLPVLVDAEWLADHQDVEELIVVHVDQRQESYEEGHIPGARFLPWNRITAESETGPTIPPVELLILVLSDLGIHDDTYVVVYGPPLFAARAWATLDYVGIGHRAALLDGGLEAWKAEGLPLSTTSADARTGTLSLWPERQRVVDADWIVERLDDPSMVFIDARTPAEFTGEDGGRNGQFIPGHIPGAKNIPWQELVISSEDSRLIPEAELRARFEAAGAGPDRTVVVYCGTGVRASVAYFVSRMLGYERRLYDGSWTDWSARELPAETGE